MKVIGYCRVSTDAQEREGHSIEEQEERIRAYCKARDLTLVAVGKDVGWSGGVPFRTRSAGGVVMSMLEKGQADGIVVFDISRLTRGLKDLLEITEQIQVISLHENIDTTTPAGRAALSMMGLMNQFQREALGDRIRSAMDRRKKSGVANSQPCWGFSDDGQGRMIPNHLERRCYDAAMVERKKGRSWDEIAEAMNRICNGRHPRRGTRWVGEDCRRLVTRAQNYRVRDDLINGAATVARAYNEVSQDFAAQAAALRQVVDPAKSLVVVGPRPKKRRKVAARA